MIHVLVKLDVLDFVALDEFERSAALVMQSYGGEIVCVFETERTSKHRGCEVHVLQFPSESRFEEYRDDVRLGALSELREKAIGKTEVTISDKIKSYSSAGHEDV